MKLTYCFVNRTQVSGILDVLQFDLYEVGSFVGFNILTQFDPAGIIAQYDIVEIIKLQSLWPNYDLYKLRLFVGFNNLTQFDPAGIIAEHDIRGIII